MPDFDLSAQADSTIHTEYVITRPDGPPIELDEPGGYQVSLGITTGTAPLRAGERLWQRRVTVNREEWAEVEGDG